MIKYGAESNAPDKLGICILSNAEKSTKHIDIHFQNNVLLVYEYADKLRFPSISMYICMS